MGRGSGKVGVGEAWGERSITHMPEDITVKPVSTYDDYALINNL